jgi:hypothetical protein
MSALLTPPHKHKDPLETKEEGRTHSNDKMLDKSQIKVIESEQNLIPKDMDNDSTQLSKKRLMLSQKGR